MESKMDGNPGGPKEYYVLVDYDNFVLNVLGSKRRDATYSLFDVVKQLDSKSDFFCGATARSKVYVFLYGGWYFYDRQSYDAQNLSYLRGKSLTYYKDRTPLYVYYRLSEQLFSMENNSSPLYATFRRTPFPSDQCPTCRTIKPGGYQNYQKMVDTMLCCDLLYLSEREKRIAVVTADDDLVPPLLQESLLGNPVYHVLTAEPEPSSAFRLYYEPLCPDNYHRIVLN